MRTALEKRLTDGILDEEIDREKGQSLSYSSPINAEKDILVKKSSLSKNAVIGTNGIITMN